MSAPSQANGWYRVTGTKNSPTLTKVSHWLTVQYEAWDDLSSDFVDVGFIVVGISIDEVGLIYNDASQFVNELAGYVEEKDVISVSPFDISDTAWQSLSWDRGL